ncbi:MAG: hypothetical protein AAFO70_06925 [Pseudomonadota bacterium]
MSRETVLTVLEDESGDTLAVALKSMDIEAPQAHRIAMYTFPEVGLHVDNARRASAFYGRLEVKTSKQAVALWPRDEPEAPDTFERRRASEGVRTFGGESVHRAEARPTFGRRKQSV